MTQNNAFGVIVGSGRVLNQRRVVRGDIRVHSKEAYSELFHQDL